MNNEKNGVNPGNALATPTCHNIHQGQVEPAQSTENTVGESPIAHVARVAAEGVKTLEALGLCVLRVALRSHVDHDPAARATGPHVESYEIRGKLPEWYGEIQVANRPNILHILDPLDVAPRFSYVWKFDGSRREQHTHVHLACGVWVVFAVGIQA